MNDDVIKSVTIIKDGKITWPPPPLNTPAIAKAEVKSKENQNINNNIKSNKSGMFQLLSLLFGGAFILFIGNYAPSSFMQHFTVFVLSCFVGFQVIWNVNHALHTPLMAITNAISGIIVIGALLQINSSNYIVSFLASVSVLIATINIVGGFLVTKKMLQMFKKS